MRFLNRSICLLLLLASCRHPDPPGTRDIVMVANLVDDSLKVDQYLAYHRKIWPEVEAGFRKAGYRNIRLYRFNRTLVMIVTIPADADPGAMGRVAEAYDPKCREWNQLMAGYQVGVPGARLGEKWVQADLYYQFNLDSGSR